MIDLLPSAAELAELQVLTEPNPGELLMAEYDELLRDKSSIADLPCHQWRDESCHCHEVAGSLDSGPVHTQQAGKQWCVTHQSVDCDEVHPHITFEQFKRRRQIHEALLAK